MEKLIKVLMPLGPGFEEIEALTVVDIFRRAGIQIIIAGTVDGPIAGRSKIQIIPDDLLENLIHEKFDMIFIPGGPGTDLLNKDSRILEKIRVMNKEHKFIAAICAAPKVLHTAGIIQGKTITSFPGTKKELTNVDYSEDRVVVDGKIITSRGAGTAMEFALKLVEILMGPNKANEIGDSILA